MLDHHHGLLEWREKEKERERKREREREREKEKEKEKEKKNEKWHFNLKNNSIFKKVIPG